jgi:KDO2-lipid IV(A) lauroyltransferase
MRRVMADAPVPDRAPRLSHRLEYGALRLLLGVLGALPPRTAAEVGAWVGALGYSPLRIRRRVVESQVAAAFPGLDDAAVRGIARAAYAHLGREMVETMLLPARGPGAVLERFSGCDGWEHATSAMDAGRGLIIVSGHIGNWELAGSYVAARGIPIDVIVRRQSNPLFDGYIGRTRERIGMHVVYDADAVRRSPRALRENRAVAFISDQGVKGLASTFVPFFGRPAKTPRGPAVLALRLDVPVVFAAAFRQPDGRYRMIFEPVLVERTGDRDADVDAIVLRYTRALERWVRRYPEQYFWHHRRWRRQPDDTPAELREPA